MNRKETIYWAALVLGILSAAAALLLHNVVAKSVGGVMIGLGGGLSAMAVCRLCQFRFEQRHPEVRRQSEIDRTDERSVMLRSRAKAKAGDVSQWAMMGVAFFSILMDAPLWVTLLTVGCYALYNVLYLCFLGRYQKEM